MDDLLAVLLSAIAEIFFEAFLQLILEVLLASFARLRNRIFSSFLSLSPLLTFFGYLLLGLAAGALSLLVLAHPLIHRSPTHGISIIVSPLVTGLIMSQIGAELRKRGKHSVRIESFSYGFAFALGMAVIRVMFTR